MCDKSYGNVIVNNNYQMEQDGHMHFDSYTSDIKRTAPCLFQINSDLASSTWLS